MHVLIIGAGITGLTAALGFVRSGHRVSVYERKDEETFATEGGAGIELQSNAMRVLNAWNIDISSVGHSDQGTELCRYANGEIIASHLPLSSDTKWWMLRSDFRRLMFGLAEAAGAKFHFGKNLQAIDTKRLSATFNDGEIVQADFIVGADGVRSRTRRLLFPGPNSEAKATSECAFDVQLPFSALNERQRELIVDNPHAQLFLGPGRSLVVGRVYSRQILDMIFVMHEYPLDHGSWYEYIDSVELLQKQFSDFWSPMQDLLRLADGCWKWRYAEADAALWSSDNGKVMAIGDAAHAMTPHSAQGGSMCIEDAAALVEFYKDGVPEDRQEAASLAKLYQEFRKPRTSKVQERARRCGMMWSMPDGPGQQKRDLSFKSGEGRKRTTKGDQHAQANSIAFEVWLESYDVIEEARRFVHSYTSLQANL